MLKRHQDAAPAPESLARVIDRNIGALIARRREEDARANVENRVARSISNFAGSMKFVYLHVVIFGVWIVVNVFKIPGIPQFDKTLVVLAMAASVEAIFISTFVLITQNRMAEAADKRADLDLQISLLAEHEITKLITLVRAVAERMGVQESRNPELDELAKDVAPERVMDRIEHHTKKSELEQ